VFLIIISMNEIQPLFSGSVNFLSNTKLSIVVGNRCDWFKSL